jgi:hypothetical protein
VIPSSIYLLASRAGFAGLARCFPAFDTCLALYWAHRHPGMSMVEFVRNQSSLGGVVDWDDNLRENHPRVPTRQRRSGRRRGEPGGDVDLESDPPHQGDAKRWSG